MNKRILYLFLVCILPAFIFGQQGEKDCSKIRSGIFYFYPENNQNGFVVVRKKDIQSEINLATADTSFWQASWKNNCELNLKFIRKNRSITNEERGFYDVHVSVVKVLEITKDYYTFKVGLDSINNKATIDTLWFRARVN